MKTNKSPTEEWLRIASEMREQQGASPPAPDSEVPAAFVTRVLADRRALRRAVPAPWYALAGLGRAATFSAVLAVACVVFIVSSGALDDFDSPVFPAPEEMNLP